MSSVTGRRQTPKNLADVRTLQTLDHRDPLLPLCNASATGSTVRCQHEQYIVDPPSIIKLFQKHPSDIALVDTVEVIRMQEAVALLIRPGMHVVAFTQKHPGEHGEACSVQHGF
jgi:hypothetical protein